jgi:hypothetical protein
MLESSDNDDDSVSAFGFSSPSSSTSHTNNMELEFEMSSPCCKAVGFSDTDSCSEPFSPAISTQNGKVIHLSICSKILISG